MQHTCRNTTRKHKTLQFVPKHPKKTSIYGLTLGCSGTTQPAWPDNKTIKPHILCLDKFLPCTHHMLWLHCHKTTRIPPVMLSPANPPHFLVSHKTPIPPKNDHHSLTLGRVEPHNYHDQTMQRSNNTTPQVSYIPTLHTPCAVAALPIRPAEYRL